MHGEQRPHTDPMQMSEPFAATVAAVAPVVWLVGAVEYHQVAKRAAEGYTVGEELLAQAVEDLKGASDTEVLAHQWTESQQQLLVGPIRLVPLFPLYVLWTVVTACLLYAMVVSLAWLAKGDDQNKASGQAVFCYCTLGFSFLIVTVTPVIAAVGRMFRSAQRRQALRAELERLKAEAQSRRS